MAGRLRGMTWSHSRGYSSIVAVSQRYEELHPGTEIRWEKRSLADFENQPVGQLAEAYDLLIIDHPWTGFAAASGVLCRLEELLPGPFLQDQAAHSVGASYGSYTIEGHQMALPIDGATPIAAYRPDLIGTPEAPLPATWDELIRLAKSGGTVFAAAPLYTLLDFFMMCATLAGGTQTLYQEDALAPREIAREALERQRELAAVCPPLIFEINPIELLELMSGEGAAYAYCPFVFGYSNYFRPGYHVHQLKAANVVSLGTHGMLRTTLGGTGLAISARCKELETAADFCQFALSAQVQKTLYFDAGGQPGYLDAWKDPAVNARSGGFFQNTLATLERASMRPRYNGYMYLQDRGGDIVQAYLKTGHDLEGTLDKLDALYHASRRGEK